LNSVFVDSGLIRRVLENLVWNGVEAMPDGGSLTVSAVRDEDNVVIEVIDTGVGFKEEDQKQVFEPCSLGRRGV
jgi:signal transduction histidine kinase